MKFNDYIYATSFAGGLRRFKYTVQDPAWELIPLPMDFQIWKVTVKEIKKACLKGRFKGN